MLTLHASNGTSSPDLVRSVTEALAEVDAVQEAVGDRPLGVGLGTFLASGELDVEPDVYIDGLLSSETSGWIAGEEKLGKTYYGLEEALCLALGLSVCGRFAVPTPRRVLFIEEEDSPRRVRVLRIPPLLRGHDLDPDDQALLDQLDRHFRIEVWSGFTFDDARMVERLRAGIADFKPSVVYIDVLRKVTLRDLNKAAEASGLLMILDQLRREYGVVFRILAHFRKVQGFRAGRGSQEIGGSFVLGAWAESSLFFEPIGRKHGAVRVEVQTKDGAPLPAYRFRIESEGPRHAPTVVRLRLEEQTETGPADSDELVFQAIATLPRVEALAGKPGVPRDAIVAAVKRSKSTVQRSLRRLEDGGRVLVTGKMTKQIPLYAVNES